MDFLGAINWEQLGTSGALIAVLGYLYKQERTERRHWQDKAFDGIETHSSNLQSAVNTLDQAIRLLK